MDGNFHSAEGVLQALDLDDGKPLQGHFAYNLDPGFIMEALAAHYRLTGDRRADCNTVAHLHSGDRTADLHAIA